MPMTVNNMVLQVETEDLKLKQVIGDGKEQIIIEAEVEVPRQKPPIEQVLKVNAKVKPHAKIKVINDKVIVDGTVEVDVLYVGDTKEGDQPVHHMEHDLKFAGYVDVEGAEECMDADVDVEIENVSWDMINDCKLRITIVLAITARVTEVRETQVVTDMKLVPPGTVPTPAPTAPTVTPTTVTIPGTGVTIPIEGGPMTTTTTPTTGMADVVVGGVAQTQYTVVSGDTLGHIAQRFGTTVDAIARANNIQNVNRLRVGQVLIIPARQ